MRGVGETVLLVGLGVVGAGLAGTLPDVTESPAASPAAVAADSVACFDAFGVSIVCPDIASDGLFTEGGMVLTTVDGVDYPICAVEDCSDQPGQVGVWINSAGERWLSLGEYSLLIEP